MDTSELVQGSLQWIDARVGSVGGSRVGSVFTKPRAGSLVSKVRESLFADLLAERLTGRPSVPSYSSVDSGGAVAWGGQTEPFARAAYEAKSGNKVELVGLIRHPTVPYSHASPDGIVGADGMIECKCPNTATHLETIRKGKIPSQYLAQMKWGLACTGRKWCDFVSFDPRAEEHQFFCMRLEATPNELREMELGVFAFVMELEARLAAHQWNEES